MIPKRPLTFLARLRSSRRGNILMIFAFAMIPMVFATGMGIDYARAARLQTKLNALADAAALSAVTQQMMTETNSTACTTATNMFKSQSVGTKNLQFTVTLKDNSGTIDCASSSSSQNTAASYNRTAVVKYTADSANTFAGILGKATIPIGGSSQAYSAVAPDIDFYLMLDTSGSMSLPTTTAGITTMTSKFKCAFACHEDNVAQEANDGNYVKAYDASGKAIDHFTWAGLNGIPLRVDEMRSATISLMDTAQSTASSNQAVYQMSVSTFAAVNTFKNLVPLTNNFSLAKTQATSVNTSIYCYNNNIPQRDSSGNIKYDASKKMLCTNNNDEDTASSDAFTKINTLMPAPGTGHKGDKPQEIMFIITDGMRDENRPSGRPEVAFDTATCTAIKSRNIRIAILYTEYLPATIANDPSGWSQGTGSGQGNVLNRLNLIEPALQTSADSTIKGCASPGLYYKVTTDGDISAALTNLFQQAVSTARLNQ